MMHHVKLCSCVTMWWWSRPYGRNACWTHLSIRVLPWNMPKFRPIPAKTLELYPFCRSDNGFLAQACIKEEEGGWRPCDYFWSNLQSQNGGCAKIVRIFKLSAYSALSAGYECDACGEDILDGKRFFDCRKCDFSMCVKCFAQHLSQVYHISNWMVSSLPGTRLGAVRWCDILGVLTFLVWLRFFILTGDGPWGCSARSNTKVPEKGRCRDGRGRRWWRGLRKPFAYLSRLSDIADNYDK